MALQKWCGDDFCRRPAHDPHPDDHPLPPNKCLFCSKPLCELHTVLNTSCDTCIPDLAILVSDMFFRETIFDGLPRELKLMIARFAEPNFAVPYYKKIVLSVKLPEPGVSSYRFVTHWNPNGVVAGIKAIGDPTITWGFAKETRPDKKRSMHICRRNPAKPL